MKKLIVICLLAAIGAVGMIGKSNAETWCQANPQTCTNGDINPGFAINRPQAPNHWNGQHNNHPHNHSHNWGGGGPYFGLNIYTQPNYYGDPGYYGEDPSYAYDNPPPAYYSANRCDALAARLRGMGYRHVEATKCGGSSYVYFATKAGRAVQVTMSARYGSILRVANTY